MAPSSSKNASRQGLIVQRDSEAWVSKPSSDRRAKSRRLDESEASEEKTSSAEGKGDGDNHSGRDSPSRVKWSYKLLEILEVAGVFRVDERAFVAFNCIIRKEVARCRAREVEKGRGRRYALPALNPPSPINDMVMCSRWANSTLEGGASRRKKRAVARARAVRVEAAVKEPVTIRPSLTVEETRRHQQTISDALIDQVWRERVQNAFRIVDAATPHSIQVALEALISTLSDCLRADGGLHKTLKLLSPLGKHLLKGLKWFLPLGKSSLKGLMWLGQALIIRAGSMSWSFVLVLKQILGELIESLQASPGTCTDPILPVCQPPQQLPTYGDGPKNVKYAPGHFSYFELYTQSNGYKINVPLSKLDNVRHTYTGTWEIDWQVYTDGVFWTEKLVDDCSWRLQDNRLVRFESPSSPAPISTSTTYVKPAIKATVKAVLEEANDSTEEDYPMDWQSTNAIEILHRDTLMDWERTTNLKLDHPKFKHKPSTSSYGGIIKPQKPKHGIKKPHPVASPSNAPPVQPADSHATGPPPPQPPLTPVDHPTGTSQAQPADNSTTQPSPPPLPSIDPTGPLPPPSAPQATTSRVNSAGNGTATPRPQPSTPGTSAPPVQPPVIPAAKSRKIAQPKLRNPWAPGAVNWSNQKTEEIRQALDEAAKAEAGYIDAEQNKARANPGGPQWKRLRKAAQTLDLNVIRSIKIAWRLEMEWPGTGQLSNRISNRPRLVEAWLAQNGPTGGSGVGWWGDVLKDFQNDDDEDWMGKQY